MALYKLILFLSIMFLASFVNLVSALNDEAIIGGYITYDRTFKYQALVQGRLNYSTKYFPVCGGAIIHDHFVISAAICFFTVTGALKEMSFSIIAGTNNLDDEKGISKNVDFIYLPGFEKTFSIYNIAILQLSESLQIDSNPILSELELPLPYEQFHYLLALVSGYGYDWVKTDINDDGKEYVIDGSRVPFLKYAVVEIMPDQYCEEMHPDYPSQTNICGLIVRELEEQHWGICQGDIGDPLVIDNMLVGIASHHAANCNETKKSALYTKVSRFHEFISIIMLGKILNHVIPYFNRPHIFQR